MCKLFIDIKSNLYALPSISQVFDGIGENVVNPGETSIVTADQPLFEMPKQIQQEWPDFYGKDKFIVMFGGLHIEMACYKTLGDILRDRGQTCCFTEANIATPRTADSLYVC